MKTITPAQLTNIKNAILADARRIRSTGAECPAVLFLIDQSPDSGKLGNVHSLPIGHLSKDQIAALHQKQARDPNNGAAVLVQECWQSIILPGSAIPENGSTAGDPRRTEILLINLLTKTEQYLASATIHENAIDDTEFIRCGADPEFGYVGRFIREGAQP